MFNTLSIVPPDGPETARLSTAAAYIENSARHTAYASQFSSVMSTNGGGANTHEIKKPIKQLRGGGWVMSNKKVLSQQRGSTQGVQMTRNKNLQAFNIDALASNNKEQDYQQMLNATYSSQFTGLQNLYGETRLLQRRNNLVLKSEGSAGDLYKGIKGGGQNPLLLPRVSPEKSSYVKLRRDLASLMPRLCGETAQSVYSQHGDNSSTSRLKHNLGDIQSDQNVQSQLFNIQEFDYPSAHNVKSSDFNPNNSMIRQKSTGIPPPKSAGGESFLLSTATLLGNQKTPLMKRFSVGTNSAVVGGSKIKQVFQGENDDLGLNGESVMIKDTMMKAVNYESVFERFQEKLQASSNETRLLFRQKRAQPHQQTYRQPTSPNFKQQTPLKDTPRTPIRNYYGNVVAKVSPRKLHRFELESSFFRQITIKESLKGRQHIYQQPLLGAANNKNQHTSAFNQCYSNNNQTAQDSRKVTPNLYTAMAPIANTSSTLRSYINNGIPSSQLIPADFTLHVKVTQGAQKMQKTHYSGFYNQDLITDEDELGGALLIQGHSTTQQQQFKKQTVNALSMSPSVKPKLVQIRAAMGQTPQNGAQQLQKAYQQQTRSPQPVEHLGSHIYNEEESPFPLGSVLTATDQNPTKKNQ